MRLRLFFITLIASIAQPLVAGPLEDRGWLAFGDMRGYIEPCGCDPEADLGGIQRQGIFLEKERALNPKLLLFNLGNNLPPNPKDEPHKVPILLKAVKRIEPDAVLFNRLEQIGYEIYPKGFRGVPYVAANLIQRKSFKGIQPFVKVDDVYITGFVSPAPVEHKTFTSFSDKLLQKWRKDAKGAEQTLLLFSGSEKDLKKIHATKFFDQIISANAALLNKVVGPEEKKDPTLLDRLNGKVRMTPIGGQGVLRGGKLIVSRAKSLSELLGDDNCSGLAADSPECRIQEFGKSKPTLSEGQPLSWLTKSYAGESPLDDLYEEYQKASEALFATNAKKRAEELADSRFAGSKACKSCHPSAYKTWRGSRHAHAFNILKKTGNDKIPECVGCHVLGYHDKGGFVSEELSPEFAHVNCENCHGPRKGHVKNPAKKHPWRGKSKQVCTSCHHGTHTSNFVFEEYWKKIKHGR